MKENHPMFSHPIQEKAYGEVAAALPFAIDPAKITVEPGVSYLPSPIKLPRRARGHEFSPHASSAAKWAPDR
jgi:hypothetical protein